LTPDSTGQDHCAEVLAGHPPFAAPRAEREHCRQALVRDAEDEGDEPDADDPEGDDSEAPEPANDKPHRAIPALLAAPSRSPSHTLRLRDAARQALPVARGGERLRGYVRACSKPRRTCSGPLSILANENALAGQRRWRAPIEIPFTSPRRAQGFFTHRGAANLRGSGPKRGALRSSFARLPGLGVLPPKGLAPA
jgi:hypothetical protein